MSTFGTMADRIADELARADLTTQIQKAIKSAVAYYERKPFYFNENQFTLSTSISQEYYGSADNSNIPGLSNIDSVRITVGTTHYTLEKRDFAYIDEVSSSTNTPGDPTDYTYYRQQLRLYPIPNAARVIVVSGTTRQATLSATTDTNCWTTDGEELIRSRATWYLYKNVIKDREQAEDWKETELEALATLRGDDAERLSTWRFRPTAF
jgi:hypothetical protein